MTADDASNTPDRDDSTTKPDDLAARAVSGSLYSLGASTITWTLGFLRMVLLARLLFPEHFGIMTQALVFLNLAAQLRGLGLDNAYIHRKNADQTVFNTYCTVRIGSLAGSLLLLTLATPTLAYFYPDMPLLPSVLFALIGMEFLKGLNTIQETVLNKQLAFDRLAIANVVGSITMTIVAPLLAWYGWGVWSLVAEYVSGQIARAAVIWRAPSRRRLQCGWDRDIARWFWHYGRSVWANVNITALLNRFDDFWVGSTLGQTPLGLYSRAYEFAQYPRRVVANPLLSVFYPTFARLQEDRLRLSRAFFRVTSLMIRVGVWFSLIFILTAPEFIGGVLGEKWLPMTLTFQLMILYVLIDPLLVVASNLMMASGHPGWVTRVRGVQTVFFIPAVIGLSAVAGIEGVAVAADLMIFIGGVLLFRQTRRLVDYSVRALWLWPLVLGVVTAGIVMALEGYWQTLSWWGRLGSKAICITIVYGVALWIVEREQLYAGWVTIWKIIRPQLNRIIGQRG